MAVGKGAATKLDLYNLHFLLHRFFSLKEYQMEFVLQSKNGEMFGEIVSLSREMYRE